jgi:hypothetical protein
VHNAKFAADPESGRAWQDVTVRLIAQRGVFHGKAPVSTRRKWTLRGFFGSHRAVKQRRPSLGAPIAASSALYLQDETAQAKVSLPPPLSGRKFHLFCSMYNAGALTLAEELKESECFVTKGKKASATLSFTTNVDELAECDHSSKAVQNLRAATCLCDLSPALPLA